jgi:hypothetical protein
MQGASRAGRAACCDAAACCCALLLRVLAAAAALHPGHRAPPPAVGNPPRVGNCATRRQPGQPGWATPLAMAGAVANKEKLQMLLSSLTAAEESLSLTAHVLSGGATADSSSPAATEAGAGGDNDGLSQRAKRDRVFSTLLSGGGVSPGAGPIPTPADGSSTSAGATTTDVQLGMQLLEAPVELSAEEQSEIREKLSRALASSRDGEAGSVEDAAAAAATEKACEARGQHGGGGSDGEAAEILGDAGAAAVGRYSGEGGEESRRGQESASCGSGAPEDIKAEVADASRHMQQAQWPNAAEAYGRALSLAGWRPPAAPNAVIEGGSGAAAAAASFVLISSASQGSTTVTKPSPMKLHADDVAELHNRRGLALYKMGTRDHEAMEAFSAGIAVCGGACGSGAGQTGQRCSLWCAPPSCLSSRAAGPPAAGGGGGPAARSLLRPRGLIVWRWRGGAITGRRAGTTAA